MLVLLCVLSVLALALANTEGCPSVGTVITLDAAVKADILARHNVERAKANGYVPALVWDSALEATAQNWASQCVVQHNGNRAQDTWGSAYDASDRTKSVGENIANANGYYVGEYGMNFFIGEGANYDCASNTCNGGTGCGHYTQVMWAKTSKVGCAIVVCSSYQYLVCDYGEAGNYNNERPFPVEGCYSYTAPPAASYGCGPVFLSGSPPPSTSTPSPPTYTPPPSPPPPTYAPPPPTYTPPPPTYTPPSSSGAPGCGLSIPTCPAGYYTSSSSSSTNNNNGVIKSTSSATYNQGSSVISYSLTTNMGPGSAVSQTLQTTSRSGGGSSSWTNSCSRT